MKKIKVEEKVENGVEAFFDHEKPEDSYLTACQTSSSAEKAPYFSKTTRSVFNVLRQIFLFLPGTFFLYFASVLLTFVLLSGYFQEDIEFLLIGTAVFSISVLLTVLGLGDARKPKYFAIPLSTIIVGALVGILGVLLFDGGIKLRVFLLNSVPYYVPLAFIAPVLVKGWLDKTEE
jgi:hypothetical protein